MLADRRHLPAKEGYETKTTITPKKTLVASPGVRMRGEEDAHGKKPISQIGVGEIYNIMLAGRWAMPRTFQVGHKGRERWAEKGRDAEDYGGDVRKMYEGLRHPSVPRWMSDIVHRAAADTEIVGKRLSKGIRTYCKRCKGLETITHEYGTCEQIEKAWEIMLKRWSHMTGEHLRPTDEWVTVWGVKWGDTGGRQKGKNEEVFRNIHAAMVTAIQEESTRKRTICGICNGRRSHRAMRGARGRLDEEKHNWRRESSGDGSGAVHYAQHDKNPLRGPANGHAGRQHAAGLRWDNSSHT